MSYGWSFNVIYINIPVFLKGLLVSVEILAASMIVGTIIGLAVSILLFYNNRLLRWFSRLYITIVRSIPLLMLLIWVYFVFPILFGINISAFSTAVICFSLSLSAFLAESLRSGIESVPVNHVDSAVVLGMNRLQILRHIIFPQVARQVLPNILNHYITLFKLSSMASVITVNELLHASSTLISVTYRPLEIYTFTALMYIAIVLMMTWLASIIEKRLLMSIAKSGDNLRKVAWWESYG